MALKRQINSDCKHRCALFAPGYLQRYRAKLSLVLLTGCKSRSGEGSGRSLVRANHPPVSSVAPLAESVVNGRETVANVNNRGEAYTENLAGQRGVAPP